MTLFWIIAALLTLVALAILLRPLLKRDSVAKGVKTTAEDTLNVTVYRDQLRELDADRVAGTLTEDNYQRARVELERRLLEDVDQQQGVALQTAGRKSAWAVGMAAPLLAVGVYFTVGTPRVLSPVEMPKDTGKGVSAQQVEAMVAKLAERSRVWSIFFFRTHFRILRPGIHQRASSGCSAASCICATISSTLLSA